MYGYDSIYPTENTKLVSNSIDVGEVHTYTLIIVYEETYEDQSDDMGKTLQGKIQIYDSNSIINIEGTLDSYTEGDYVEMHSEVKTSQIKITLDEDGNEVYSYKFIGLTVGTHNIYVKNKNDESLMQQSVSITKGTEASISSDASSIVMTDNSETAYINISKDEDGNYSLSGVEIKDAININPYTNGTIAYEIFKNKALVEEYELTDSTYTSKGTQTNTEINELTTVTGVSDGTNITDSGLFSAEDDYGTSYIYRGTVRNNYVDFAGFTWRIVRINGDGTVRLILDGTLDKVYQKQSDGTYSSTVASPESLFNSSDNDNAYVGYTYGAAGSSDYDTTHKYTGDKTSDDKTGQSTIKQAVDTFYETYLLENYNSYISDTLFCGDKSLASDGIGKVTTQLGYGTNKTYYAAIERLWFSTGTTKITEATPTLKCVANNTTLTEEQKAYSRYTVNGNSINGIQTNDDLIYPIALLSIDELVMAGAFRSTINKQYYLYNSNTLSDWWSISPGLFNGSVAGEFGVSVSSYSLDRYSVNSSSGVRPVINLDSDVLYDSGDGTENSPYTVKLS